MPWNTWNLLVQKKTLDKTFFFCSYLPKPLASDYDVWKACGLSGHNFGPRTAPRPTKDGLSPYSAVHYGQCDTKYVTLELIWNAAFTTDAIRGISFQPANLVNVYWHRVLLLKKQSTAEKTQKKITARIM